MKQEITMYNRNCFASRYAPVGGFDYVRHEHSV